jgi:hypothetical protein
MPAKTVAERFWEKVDTTGECWVWTASKTSNGYGEMRGADQKKVGAHRLSFELHNGPIPEGLEVHHTCRRRDCVNPGHLRVMTHAENLQHRQYGNYRQQVQAMLFAALVLCAAGSPD